MAKYKTIKQESQRGKLEKKRARIYGIVDCIYVFLFALGILIAGINQHNSLVVGLALFGMGIISIFAAMFHIYAMKNKWKLPSWSWNIDDSKGKTEEVIVIILFILCSVVLPVWGVFEII